MPIIENRWLMTELQPIPVTVTLVQAVASQPVFLFARATLMPILLSETAGASSLRETRSGTVTCKTGMPKARVVPYRN